MCDNYIFTNSVLISLYGTPLAQRASYLALHNSLFRPDGAVTCSYDNVVTNSSNTLLMGSRCIPNGTHTEPIWPMLIKNSVYYIHVQSK